MNIILCFLFFLLIIIVFYDKKGIPIFLYHQVNPMSNVSPELFEEHLKIIKKFNMNSLTISEYFSKKPKKNSILITFDDGYFDNYKYVFPLLKKYNIKATIFLNTLYIAEKREFEPKIELNYEANYEAIKNFLKCGVGFSEQYLSWEEIREMYDSGLLDFQAHSHKHTAMFTDSKILDFSKKDKMDYTDIYLYGEAEDNFPIFSKRGEYTGLALKIKKEFFNIFKNFFNEQLINIADKKQQLILAQNFIDKNKEYFSKETEEEYKKRVQGEFLENKSLIEKNLGNKVQFFCWPWGHRSNETIKILKDFGVLGFISTKKGTNSPEANWNMIRRIELRNYTTSKFKLNLLVARNLILGKIYGFLS